MTTTITIVQINIPPDSAVENVDIYVYDGATTNLWLWNVGGVPINTPLATLQAQLDANADALLLACSGDVPVATGTAAAQQVWRLTLTPLQMYFGSIIKSLYDDVDNAGVTIDMMLSNAAALVATNATQAAKFNAYRTRLGLGGAIATMTAAQKANLLVLGLEWSAAGLAIANVISDR